MVHTNPRRWMASLTAAIVLLAGLNCVCLGPAPAGQIAQDVTTASHSCCSKTHDASKPPHDTPTDPHSKCPHCAGTTAATLSAPQATVPLPQLETIILIPDISQRHTLLPSFTTAIIHPRSPGLCAVTLLGLRCALLL